MLGQAWLFSQAEICKLHQIAQGRNNSTGSCGVPVLCKIRIAASPVQVGRPFGFVPPVSERGARSGFRAGVRQRLPPAPGLSTSAEALCQRGLLGSGFLAGPFQRRLGPDDPAWFDRPDGAVRSGGAEHPAPRLAARGEHQAGQKPRSTRQPGPSRNTSSERGPLAVSGNEGECKEKVRVGEPQPGREPRPSWRLRVTREKGAEPKQDAESGKRGQAGKPRCSTKKQGGAALLPHPGSLSDGGRRPQPRALPRRY